MLSGAISIAWFIWRPLFEKRLVEGTLCLQNQPALLRKIALTLVECKDRDVFRVNPSPKFFDHTRFYHFEKQRPNDRLKKNQTKPVLPDQLVKEIKRSRRDILRDTHA